MTRSPCCTRASAAAAASAEPLPLVAERLSDRLAARLGGADRCRRAAPRRPPADRAAARRRRTASRAPSCARRCTSSSRAALVRSRQGSGVYVTAAPSQPGARASTRRCSIRCDAVVQVRRGAARARRRDRRAGRRARHAARRSRRCAGRCARSIAAPPRARDGVAEDLAFHRVLGEAAGNPQFGRLLGFLEQYLREGDAHDARQRGDAAPTSWRRCASSTAPSSTRSPRATRRSRAAAPSST